MFYAKGTPKPIVDKMNAEIRKALGTPEIKAFYPKQALDPIGSSPEELAHWSQCASMLTELVEALPAGFREIILLREMEELSYREIADLLEVPVGTVMSRLARAREMLKRAWAVRRGR